MYSSDKINSFEFEGQPLKVKFVESMAVKAGVNCDVYEFEGDKSRDLGIVTVDKNCKTPLQRILQGEKTVEGYVSGVGTLTITPPMGQKKIYEVGDSQNSFSVSVNVGELMQWQASPDSSLVFYEICYPPYQDGRFENLAE